MSGTNTPRSLKSTPDPQVIAYSDSYGDIYDDLDFDLQGQMAGSKVISTCLVQYINNY